MGQGVRVWATIFETINSTSVKVAHCFLMMVLIAWRWQLPVVMHHHLVLVAGFARVSIMLKYTYMFLSFGTNSKPKIVVANRMYNILRGTPPKHKKRIL